MSGGLFKFAGPAERHEVREPVSELSDAQVVGHVDDRFLRRRRVAVEAGKDASQLRQEVVLQSSERVLLCEALRQFKVGELLVVRCLELVRAFRVVIAELRP